MCVITVETTNAAMDMKLHSQYLAQQLSFKGVSFKIEEVKLSSDFQKLYADSENECHKVINAVDDDCQWLYGF